MLVGDLSVEFRQVLICIMICFLFMAVTIEVQKGLFMVLVLVGNSEMGAHLTFDLGYLNCLRHWFRSRAVTNLVFFC